MGIMTGIAAAAASLWKRAPGAPVRSEAAAARLFSNRALLALFAPLVAEQFLGALFGFADSVAASRVGEAALSGISLTAFVIQLFIGVFAAFATGGAVAVGRSLGAGRKGEAKARACQLVRLEALLSVIVMAVVYPARPFILNVIFGGVSGEVRAHAGLYLTVCAASIPFLAIYGACAAIFRTEGNSRLPMKIMLAANIMNAAGNAVFACALEMGTLGIALSTLVSRAAAALAILSFAVRDGELLGGASLSGPLCPAALKEIFSVALPCGFENVSLHLGRLALMSIAASFGTASIAAGSAAGTVAAFTTMAGTAVNSGMTAVVARCSGLGSYEQLRYYHRKILLAVSLLHLAANVLILSILPLLLELYGLSAEAGGMAASIVRWHAVLAVILWPLAYTQPVTLRATGDASFAMALNVAGMFLCRLLPAYILGRLCGLGILGLYAAIFFDWGVKALFFSLRCAGRYQAPVREPDDKNIRRIDAAKVLT